VKISDKIAN